MCGEHDHSPQAGEATDSPPRSETCHGMNTMNQYGEPHVNKERVGHREEERDGEMERKKGRQ